MMMIKRLKNAPDNVRSEGSNIIQLSVDFRINNE